MAAPIHQLLLVGGGSTSWNPNDKSNVTLSGSNQTYANTNGGTQGGVRTTTSRSSGKMYFEITNLHISSNNGVGFGICTAAYSLSGAPSTGATFWTLCPANGTVDFNGTNQNKNLGAMAANDVICFAIDLDNSRGWIRHNAGNWLADAAANPATNTNGVDISALFPTNPAFIVGTSNNTAAGQAQGTLNTIGNFAQTVPSGFTAWG